ncbi:hypothetical protein [Aestuariibacter salexigens]|uniref:hypothetical protein n=1 Tax=Aestuariibacter salexigens TaxID=226010 RepID=UPI000407FA7D|nr:hypothetical protein [Aestuariibacter salexigens]
MYTEKINLEALTDEQIAHVSGGGFFYELGAFFAQQANISDSIYSQYGNTNRN